MTGLVKQAPEPYRVSSGFVYQGNPELSAYRLACPDILGVVAAPEGAVVSARRAASFPSGWGFAILIEQVVGGAVGGGDIDIEQGIALCARASAWRLWRS